MEVTNNIQHDLAFWACLTNSTIWAASDAPNKTLWVSLWLLLMVSVRIHLRLRKQ